MDEPTTDVIQGTLDMLILKTLSLEPMHGFGIARRVEQISRGVFKVNPGSLLTALQRLERAGWLDAEWRADRELAAARRSTRSRAAGRKQLDVETADWNRRVSAVARLLKAEALTDVALAAARRVASVRSSNRSAADREVADEVEHYLDEAADGHLMRERALGRRGASRRAARARQHHRASASRCARTGGRTSSMSLVADVRYGARRLRGASGLRDCQRAHAGARHRREHRDLQRGQPDPVPAAALPAGRSRS